jgi:16S rRNA (guanine966-N2)-methyltransferase
MRVVAGIVGGRTLKGPAGVDARPTMDKVRGAIFNSLNSIAAIEGARVVDLFAGTGALGIEALSRGATSVTFVEKSAKNAALIRANLATLDLRGEVYVQDVLGFSKTAGSFDVAFVDPPYAFDQWSELLKSLRAGLVVCESDRSIASEVGYEVVRTKQYGGTHVTMLRRRMDNE